VVIQYLQFVVGRSALGAAVALLPLPLVMIPPARNAPRIARRVGFRRLAPLGLALTATGLVVISQVSEELDYAHFAIGLMLFAAGMALAGTPATTAITESLPESKQGIASAVNDTARELGSALGIAILGSVLNQRYRDGMIDAVQGLPPAVAERAQSSVAFTQSDRICQLGATASQLVTTARHAFVNGISGSLMAAAGIVAATALIVARLAPAPPRRWKAAQGTTEESQLRDDVPVP
jgi:fucose permease